MEMNEPTNTDPAAASRALHQVFTTFEISRAIYVAAKLGIADLLSDGPQAVDHLAAVTQSHAHTLHRLLRLLASEGIFVESSDGTFALTSAAAALQQGAPNSIRSMVLLRGDPAQQRAWEALEYSVQTGLPAFDHVWGEPAFDYYSAHPLGEIFSEAMTEVSRRSSPQVARAYDFSSFRSLVDVGGGQGLQLVAILREYPKLRGILFDLPQVVQAAPPLIASHRVEDRCEVVGGDFFDGVPEGADAYLINRVLRDWPDERAIKIVQACRRAATQTSKLLIVEPIIGFGNHDIPPERLDLQMQVLFGSMVRTLDEFERIVSAAGFRFMRAVPTPGPLSIIEAVPQDEAR